ncbi:MAG: hypothetical protein KF773_08910 [Deltaproteobacteria bacterium]|nr:hypothetical protein [Deltaproteobacteria bacterium]
MGTTSRRAQAEYSHHGDCTRLRNPIWRFRQSRSPAHDLLPRGNMDLVPSYLRAGSAVFPLQVVDGVVYLSYAIPGLNALCFVLRGFRATPQTARAELSEVRIHWFGDKHVAACPTADMADEDLTNGWMNWLRLTGEPPPKTGSYHTGTSFLPDVLVVPRAVLLELLEQMIAIDAGIAQGTIEARLDGTPVPALPPAPASVVEYDRLRDRDWDPAHAHALKVIRGEPWTPSPPEPEYDPSMYEVHDDDGDDRQPEPDGPPAFTITPVNPIARPEAIAKASILRELEAMVAELDALDEQARDGGETYEDAELEARCAARRQRVLIELEVAGLFERSLADAARAALAGLPALRAYHEAAMELHAYLDSRERAEIVRKPRPDSLLDSDVSLDWFRRPSGQTAEGIAPWTWLALGERAFENPAPFRAGRRFTRLAGQGCTLFYRTEAKAAPSLWRAFVR